MDGITIIVLSIGTLLTVLYCIMLVVGTRKYGEYIEGLQKGHLFKVLYPVGFYVLERMNYSYSSKLDIRRYKESKAVFGEQYGEYYFRLNYAQKVGVGLFPLPFTLLAYACIQNWIVLVFGVVLMALAYWNYDMKITDVMTVRNAEIERELPKVLSKLTLLVNAGMILSEAWVRVSESGNSTLYVEMKNAVVEIRNGKSEIEAYMHFAERCLNAEVKKFVSTLAQNITKGNRELVDFLKQQTAISWEEKKHHVRRQGEKAKSKLLLPIGIMFFGILILVIVPIFSNFSF